jgi:hypothetical protein
MHDHQKLREKDFQEKFDELFANIFGFNDNNVFNNNKDIANDHE